MAPGMDGEGGTGFSAARILLFDGSSPLEDLVVEGGGGGWCMGVGGRRGLS